MAYERLTRQRFLQHFVLSRARDVTGIYSGRGKVIAEEAIAAWEVLAKDEQANQEPVTPIRQRYDYSGPSNYYSGPSNYYGV